MNLTLNPCASPGGHDFVVGFEAAICNRCEKVVHIVPPGLCGHEVFPASSRHRLTCHLLYGHKGNHGDRDGASWSRDGSEWTPGRKA